MLLNMFDKLDDIVYLPIKMITDWAGEPLKHIEHKRQIELKEIDHKIKVEQETAMINAEAKIKKEEKELDTALAIKKETEVQRVLVEIEECRKDRELERMKCVSEAIMRYQKELTKLNTDAVMAIGQMQLDLKDQAQSLVYEKTIKYKELQDVAFAEAAIDLEKIEERFSDNTAAREILLKAVDRRLANIIDTAHNFLIELNDDIKLLNQNINLLAERGHTFIEDHLDKFHVIETTAQEVRKLKG
ncbi:hypothetical protein [Halomicronema sp. CCY15110]|uniref:hypothetical protein n=1 Tax=Halomicronema sp. CCY15110 TaxID=2767773 RepID=UPI00194F7C7D|nr:hypothetical protein [Halomicronema sp. CCY15110]